MQVNSAIQLQASPEQVSTLTTEPSLADALAEARTMAEEQRALSQALRAAGDPKHWYVQLCHLTTQEMLQLIEAHQLPHPSWALRLLSLLHARFLHNLRRWLSPTLGCMDPHWESAFSAFNLAGEATTVYSVLTGLHLALRAQLECDLPLAVAQTLGGERTTDYARFRADLQGTSLALRRAVERLLAQTAAPHLPGWLARRGARLLGETLALLVRRYVYDVAEQRARAFARGVQLAETQLQRTPAGGQAPGRSGSVQKVQAPADPYRGLSLLPSAAPASPSVRDSALAAAGVTSRQRAACETFPDSEADAA